ncbi:MGH1-like glycoside hydrolase domain-containing protein [Xanthocytophaga flavus]|uniref:MGH1-like glycoside hydrolase domain-containing protein n=1 Tax=Xanthocytophaga flava TaxID=3048013 RepID=UPI00391F1978
MSAKTIISAEQQRLNQNATHPVPLEKWGPYLAERQWGTVREDYSSDGNAWNYFPFKQSHARAYRWGEDGIAGISDFGQNLCFALTLWNGKDPLLKERLFGLTNGEGNHGEDCKELYYYLDNTPTHSYMRFLYKYPQNAFPYEDLIRTNAQRGKSDPEYELLDTGIFNENKYFDVYVTYAKNDHEDICIEIEVFNQSEEPADITLLPTLWCRNRWLSGDLHPRPTIQVAEAGADWQMVSVTHGFIGTYHFYFPKPAEDLLFTENDSNLERLFGVPNPSPYVKDAFHDVIIQGNNTLLKDKQSGTKFAPVYRVTVSGKSSQKIYFRLSKEKLAGDPFAGIEQTFVLRKQEADIFYQYFAPLNATEDAKNIQRQAFAGLLWSKQYYQYDVERWLNGDHGQPAPPESRKYGRNANWKYIKNEDIISMPDTWEYPWYAAWDLAFHCVTFGLIDPAFAKNQLILMLREWYMNPEGQIPAYEWNFSDVNPPVHAWAALSVYRIERTIHGKHDINFLKRIFQKLLINFTWWVNRKDEDGNNIFSGGFLGLDNIGVLNRSAIPPNCHIEQVDGTSWMAMYALNMMDIALEIAVYDKSFEDVATKFYEHYVLIAESLNEALMWDEKDHFFYDVLYHPNGEAIPMKVRSVVGLSVLFAVSIIDVKKMTPLPDFIKRIAWFKNYRIKTGKYLPNEETKDGDYILISLIPKEKLIGILEIMLDEEEFLAPGGIRALSKYHDQHPYFIHLDGIEHTIRYDPGESTSYMFGGNSNWRGPVWTPINYLLIKALKKYHQFYGDSVKLEFPTRSGNWMTLGEISNTLAERMVHIFEKDSAGNRPVHKDHEAFYSRPENQDLLLFYEYFHGDTSRGIGASHQTGWTAVIAELINDDAWEWE